MPKHQFDCSDDFPDWDKSDQTLNITVIAKEDPALQFNPELLKTADQISETMLSVLNRL